MYKNISIDLKAKYSQISLTDVTDEDRQKTIIFDEHKRAHRGYIENKIQILKKYYWPRMAEKKK